LLAMANDRGMERKLLHFSELGALSDAHDRVGSTPR
jgi:hypothetical protein